VLVPASWNGEEVLRRRAAMAQEKSDKDVKEQVERDLAEIEALRSEAHEAGLAFKARTKKDLEQKIREAASGTPYIYAAAWSSRLPAGATANYRVYVRNPDPVTYSGVFVTVFWGLANLFANIYEGLIGRDARWPYLSSEPFTLTSGASTSKSFDYVTPSWVDPSTYLGNAVFWQHQPVTIGDRGAYFDHDVFYITLT